MAVHYCEVCRRTSFSGRRHLYSAAHQRRLREALGRLQEEVAAARAAAAAAGDEDGDGGGAVRRYDPAEHERRVWCLCCGRGVRRDGRRGGLALPQAGLLQHLAGPEHRRETARFWRENRAEAALRERFLVPAEEYDRFARALERALAAHQRREEERIRQMAAGIREAERRQQETVQAALQLQAEPELCAGPSGCSPPAGPKRSFPNFYLDYGKHHICRKITLPSPHLLLSKHKHKFCSRKLWTIITCPVSTVTHLSELAPVFQRLLSRCRAAWPQWDADRT
ncbi:centrosomal AT-AC splicing factor isoform X3 [Calonectris borealis]|uniref:centrosomal AT-AC splicing factor isoform X3 n=1 Tax=Calonectris borealis TaxID=1323832 RepID=UPI003F4B3F4C